MREDGGSCKGGGLGIINGGCLPLSDIILAFEVMYLVVITMIGSH